MRRRDLVRARGAVQPNHIERLREPVLRILFIHGAGSQDTDDSSQPLLRGLRGALSTNAAIDAPIMPEADSPDAAAWDAAVAGQMAAIGEDFIAAGHSLGGSTILRAIALHGAPPTLLGVVTMAMPFWNAPDWEVPDYALPEDVSQLAGVPLSLWFSTDDETVAIDHLDRYRALLPHAKTRRISGTGHLFDAAPFDEIARDIVALAEHDR